MHLLCPHCHNAIELIEASLSDEILCPSCGTTIRLDSGSTGAHVPQPRRLGRFEVIDRVGQGAFGSVFKARDPELDRVVAIKVPRVVQLAEGQELDRFLREARSVAQLRHPSIVSVHEVGQSDGVPYLVEDFVAGVTLADVLTARRLSPRESAELIARVADALHYAHERGVVHRDIKPSNIMLDPDGTPHVMDFGLAKRDAGEITMTVEGQVLGTPAYMSPEQARGESHRVDGRSDVYSLGVILYQLLTGELPFRGNQRMLLHQVLHEEPRAPRSLNDRVPRDLETICSTAMAKEPARRYQTAGALGDDLRRYLKGNPILARPVGRLEIAWRWVKRRPATAALIGVSSAAVASLLLGSLYHNARLSGALREKEKQQSRAEDNFQKAQEAVESMLTQVGENKDLEGIPQWLNYRQKFLEDARTFWEGFLKDSDDPDVRRETGLAYQRVGRIYQMLGKQQAAIESLNNAIVIQEQLADFANDPRDAGNLATSYHQLGYLYENRQLAAAEGYYQKSLAIRERLATASPDNLNYLQDLALTNSRLAFTLALAGRQPDANKALDKAMNLLDRLVRTNSEENRFQIAFAECCRLKALLLRENKKWEESLDWNTQSVTKLESVLRREPQCTQAKAELSWALMERAETLVRLKREREAREAWKRRAELGEKQSHVDLRIGRAQSLAQLGQHVAAVAEIEAMIAGGQEPQQALYSLACVYARCALAAGGDPTLPAPQREELVNRYCQKAVDHLRKAHARGFFTPYLFRYMQDDTDIAPIRSLPDYKRLELAIEQDLKQTGK